MVENRSVLLLLFDFKTKREKWEKTGKRSKSKKRAKRAFSFWGRFDRKDVFLQPSPKSTVFWDFAFFFQISGKTGIFILGTIWTVGLKVRQICMYSIFLNLILVSHIVVVVVQ
jgi:hypothetical protein